MCTGMHAGLNYHMRAKCCSALLDVENVDQISMSFFLGTWNISAHDFHGSLCLCVRVCVRLSAGPGRAKTF